ncbi:MAG: hypothetical protein A2744_04005 [Candidatus Buchananbacteria bacterium RIFCSPHIGHO2_01_FULL_44_11]|uniref:Uncharacterized protein n=1 Tax=Candidatus Buchananbacteria bacterium RIFCSPHIGHO2_01_FULL_44_11 TaxID=1797535 RepID=A0A1G1Y2Q3_9BACT|nr:MAG: hypothetical protein A2744_04005 [Candidatus Buchananbacteria bacterium RIFCSPHIGHO2_01_FULL_44_11]
MFKGIALHRNGGATNNGHRVIVACTLLLGRDRPCPTGEGEKAMIQAFLETAAEGGIEVDHVLAELKDRHGKTFTLTGRRFRVLAIHFDARRTQLIAQTKAEAGQAYLLLLPSLKPAKKNGREKNHHHKHKKKSAA